MNEINILWADDEIDLLKPHILFLEEKGYRVFTATSGDDALEYLEYQPIDIVFLDENMPGLTGLETLTKIKETFSSLPVVMITKSEEEHIMEDAIGSKISDYLIKPVNPKQILLSVKKNLDTRRLVREKTSSEYQQEFRQLSMRINDRLDADEWTEVYRKLVYWELELDKSKGSGMGDILSMQKEEANNSFCRFYEDNYLDWINGRSEVAPIMSHTLFPKRILPQVKDGEDPLVVICIDNMRYDQWKTIEPIISNYYRSESEELYYSILPTATSFSRNALFSGLLPTEIESRYGKQWFTDDNDFTEEQVLLEGMVKLYGKSVKSEFIHVSNIEEGKKLADTLYNHLHNDLLVISYNFVDMMTHAKTDMEVIKELADDESAYRSVSRSWFDHSPLLEIIQKLAEKKVRVNLTTDHGSIRVSDPSKVIGDRNTNTNLRYKQGKNLDYQKRDVFVVDDPREAHLPAPNMNTEYIFSKGDKYFIYPNNYNHFVQFYKDTFQHGGISLEEVLIPFVTLSPKNIL
ncbi:PglZ domain-containing protein [bacterium SCSIO 12741]|nr:PglZ domain-containing protein [bacterium SCSIO 12741]